MSSFSFFPNTISLRFLETDFASTLKALLQGIPYSFSFYSCSELRYLAHSASYLQVVTYCVQYSPAFLS